MTEQSDIHKSSIFNSGLAGLGLSFGRFRSYTLQLAATGFISQSLVKAFRKCSCRF
jgi:hypothetical protein